MNIKQLKDMSFMIYCNGYEWKTLINLNEI